jgi:uncharacterized membrane protein
MPDPADPNPPPPVPPPAAQPSSDPSSMDLPPNIAAAIACIPLIGGIIFYILEKRNSFVRFYAMQSIIFGGVWILFAVVHAIARAILTPIPAIGLLFGIILWIVWALVNIAVLVLFVVTVVKAFTNIRWDIPYIGPLARKQLGEAA